MRSLLGWMPVCVVLFAFSLICNNAQASGVFVPAKTVEPVVLDGNLDDKIWQEAIQYDDFITASPDVGLKPAQSTVVQLAYDTTNLYFAIRAFDSEPALIKSALMGWDSLYSGDYVGVYVDALNDSHGAWCFVANAHGSQGDCLVGPSGDMDVAPDNTWQTAAMRDSLGYTVEMAIPLRSLRFPEGQKVQMGIGFERHISRRTEYSYYPEYRPYRGTIPSQLAQAEYDGLQWERTWELLPSIVHTERTTRQGDELVRQDDISGTQIGLTSKTGITPTMTLDLAINPDFSQIEADAGQVDLNLRSLVFYPEKRPFFQEGSDYFKVAATSASGFASVVHTRQIIDPLVGLRVTGKAGPKNAVGIIYAEDEAPGILDDSGKRAIFGIARYQRQIGDESYFGGIYSRRDYRGRENQVAGVDGVWRVSQSNSLQANCLISSTNETGISNTNRAHHVAGSWLYRTRTNFVRIRTHDISKNFDLDTGFMLRDGNSYFQPSVRRFFYPESFIQKIRVGYWSYIMKDKYEDSTESWHNFFVWFDMPRSSTVGFYKFFGNEVFGGGDFDADGFYATGRSQVTKTLGLSVGYRSEGEPRFLQENPYQGNQHTSWAGLTFEPGKHIKTELDLRKQTFTRHSDGSQIFDDTLLRFKAILQVTRWFSLRAILDYRETDETGEPLNQKIQGEFLASFNYLPGTVIYAGYGSIYRSGATLSEEMNPQRSSDMLETGRSIFFKASYNWRI
ncbi:MAG: carbohydrate binding family 9 domain-containing protein [bacterium]|nr:carbohydrate binding family 9 domain-containing protein [bacterium]